MTPTWQTSDGSIALHQGDAATVLRGLAPGSVSRCTKTGRFLKGKRPSPATEFKKGQHWRPHQLFRDKDWLYVEYIAKRRSTSDIAKEFNVGNTAIQFWLKKHGIRTRTTAEVRKLKHWGAAGEKNPMFGKRGPLHHNWKGGRTPWRQKLYASYEWRQFAHMIFARDVSCRVCGSKEKRIIHHIHRFCDAPLLVMDPENVILLCTKCHLRLQGKEKYWRKRLLAIRAKDYRDNGQ